MLLPAWLSLAYQDRRVTEYAVAELSSHELVLIQAVVQAAQEPYTMNVYSEQLQEREASQHVTHQLVPHIVKVQWRAIIENYCYTPKH